MDITVRSQHGHIPGSIQDLTASKMEGLGRFLRTITSIDVEVDRDGRPNRSNAFLVRVAVVTPGPVFRSKVRDLPGVSSVSQAPKWRCGCRCDGAAGR